MYKKGGALKSFNMIEGGYLKNMGAISGGLEKIWNKKQFLLHSPLQLKLWLVPKLQLSVFLKIVWVFWVERIVPPLVIAFE